MAHPTDILIANAIRCRRRELGLTLKEVADRLDVSYQQIQKYESCQNRIAASTLADIAIILDINIEYFYKMQYPV
ncbi:helix-turn-helix domain-containing protein [Paracoccus cavernae]|uniref:helix-turn-helix domain-containing protein n=1 Tax=Paracoccus cavernae TaxID=1571207 RepID=UPI0035F23666